MANPYGLEPRVETLCREYVIDWNMTRAGRAAGFSKESAPQRASEYLSGKRGPGPVLFVAELMAGLHKRLDVTAQEVRENMTAIARADRRNLVDEDGRYKLLSEIDDETAAAVEGYKVTDKGVEIKMAPKLKAWENLAELLGMKKLQVELSHPLDRLLTDEERAAMAEALGGAMGLR